MKPIIEQYAAQARSVAEKQLIVDRTRNEIRSLEERRADLLKKRAGHGSDRSDVDHQIAKCQDKLRHLYSEVLDQEHAVRMASVKCETTLLEIKYGDH